MFGVSKLLVAISLAVVLTACGTDSSSSSSLAPKKLSDQNWKNGIWILRDGRNGFFVEETPNKINVAPATKLFFAKSGVRVVTHVDVSSPYINIFVDKPLDPEGDGWPNKVTIVK